MRLRRKSAGSVVRTKKSEIAPKAIARRNSVAPAKSAGSWATGTAALVQV